MSTPEVGAAAHYTESEPSRDDKGILVCIARIIYIVLRYWQHTHLAEMRLESMFV